LDSQNGIDIILMIRICFCPYERLLLSPENPCGYQGVGDFAQTPTLIGCWLLKSVLQTSAGRRGDIAPHSSGCFVISEEAEL